MKSLTFLGLDALRLAFCLMAIYPFKTKYKKSPDMSDGQTYEKLKKIDPNIKVLLASGYSLNGKASYILHCGCNGFIQKPFNIEELSRKIRDVLDDK